MLKARIYYAFSLVLSIVFIYTLYHRITLILFLAVLFLPLVSFILLRINYAKIKFEVSIGKNTYEKREEASTRIVISNEGFLPAPLLKIKIMQIGENGKSVDEKIYAFGLFPYKSLIFESSTVMKRRGVYEIGIKTVELYDLLGIFRFTRDANEIERILVLPKRIMMSGELSKSNISDEGDEKNRYRVGADRTILSHVRDYADGDNINSVHWKLSSKKDNLVVKVYDTPNNNNIIIVADMQSHITDDPDLCEENGDAVVEAALTVALKCVYENKGCRLYWYDTEKSAVVWYDINNFNDFDVAYDHLAVTKVSFDNITIDTILENKEICDTHNKIIYTVTQGFGIKSADTLIMLAQSDDNDINCICFDFADDAENNYYIEELSLNKVTVKKYTGNDVEASINDFFTST